MIHNKMKLIKFNFGMEEMGGAQYLTQHRVFNLTL